MDYLFKNKKGVFLGVAAVTVLIPVLILLVIIFGIPLTGLTIFLVKNGKLLAIIFGLVFAVMLLKRK